MDDFDDISIEEQFISQRDFEEADRLDRLHDEYDETEWCEAGRERDYGERFDDMLNAYWNEY